MRKLFHKVHLWLSLPFGLVIAAICFSGAALVFEKEAMELCHRKLYYVDKVGNQAMPLDQLMAIVSQTLPDSVSVSGVTIAADPQRAYQVSLSKPRRASVYIDPYTGEVKGRYERAPFFTFMFKMHRWLLDSMKPGETVYVGKLVVGISTLAFVFVLISGTVIWIPRTRKALKSRLKIATGKGLRRFWYDLHVAGGMYATCFLLAMALTGLTWSFPWYRSAFYRVFGVEVQQAAQGHHVQQGQSTKHGQSQNPPEQNHKGRQGRNQESPPKEEPHTTFTYWQQAYDQLCNLNPNYRQIGLTNGAATVSFDRMGNQRATDRYAFSPEDGQITRAMPYSNQERASKIRGWIYSVHVGNWGGITTRVLTFLAALLGGVLPLTGYYFWLKRTHAMQRRKKKLYQREE